jgi:hypothetical protein
MCASAPLENGAGGGEEEQVNEPVTQISGFATVSFFVQKAAMATSGLGLPSQNRENPNGGKISRSTVM